MISSLYNLISPFIIIRNYKKNLKRYEVNEVNNIEPIIQPQTNDQDNLISNNQQNQNDDYNKGQNITKDSKENRLINGD